jgi:hypothetical protein
VRLAAFGATSSASKDPELNVIQYGLPIFVILVIGFLFFIQPILKRRRIVSRGGNLSPTMGPQLGSLRGPT